MKKALKVLLVILFKVVEIGGVSCLLYWIGKFCVYCGLLSEPPYQFLYIAMGIWTCLVIAGGIGLMVILGFLCWLLIKKNIEWANKLLGDEK